MIRAEAARSSGISGETHDRNSETSTSGAKFKSGRFGCESVTLEASGSSLEQVLKCTVFVKSMDDFALVNEVYARFFTGESPPARACVEVSRLPKDVLVEIDCVAAT